MGVRDSLPEDDLFLGAMIDLRGDAVLRCAPHHSRIAGEDPVDLAEGQFIGRLGVTLKTVGGLSSGVG